MFHNAMPMSYRQAGLGKTYIAEIIGPPLQVKENPDAIDPSIIIELEDHFKQAGRDMFGVEDVPITRFALHLPSARL